MLQMIDKAIDSERMSSDTSRAAVFEIPKPPHQHITVQRPGNTERPVVQEKYFSWSDDEDDEEGGGPSGRISPGTFLAWARGSKRWDQGHIKDPQGVSSTSALFSVTIYFRTLLANSTSFLPTRVEFVPTSQPRPRTICTRIICSTKYLSATY